MSCIYKIENQINGKVYIGKTTHPIKQRWYEHKYNAIYQPNLKYHLYKAMRKYGIDNFDICCIEEVSDDNDLSERERYWIKYQSIEMVSRVLLNLSEAGTAILKKQKL